MAGMNRAGGSEVKGGRFSGKSRNRYSPIMALNIENSGTAAEEGRQRLRLDCGQTLKDELLAIGAHCAALPELDGRPEDEILAYDSHGLTR